MRLRQQRQLVGKKERNATIPLAQGLDARPGHFSGRNESVESRRLVSAHARREDCRLEQGSRQRRALQVLNSVEQNVQVRMPHPSRR